MIETDSQLTSGQVFARFRQMPEMRSMVEACYYDEVSQATQRFVQSEEFKAVEAYARQYGFGKNASVLDLGGGNGVGALAWEKSGYKVVLLEPDQDEIVGYGALITLREQGKTHLQIASGVGEGLPFPTHSFDIIYIRQVLHHIVNLETLFVEIYRVLKPGGLLLATREHVVNNKSDLEKFLAAHPVHRYTGGENAYQLDQYVSAIKKAGFHNLKILAPWQSVINYYPITQAQRIQRMKRFLSRYLGNRLGDWLGSKKPIQALITHIQVQFDKRPGRIYSFLAVRQ